jgi:hypothetical protein
MVCCSLGIPAGACANMTARSGHRAPTSAGARMASSSPGGTARWCASPSRSFRLHALDALGDVGAGEAERIGDPLHREPSGGTELDSKIAFFVRARWRACLSFSFSIVLRPSSRSRWRTVLPSGAAWPPARRHHRADGFAAPFRSSAAASNGIPGSVRACGGEQHS